MILNLHVLGRYPITALEGTGVLHHHSNTDPTNGASNQSKIIPLGNLKVSMITSIHYILTLNSEQTMTGGPHAGALNEGVYFA